MDMWGVPTDRIIPLLEEREIISLVLTTRKMNGKFPFRLHHIRIHPEDRVAYVGFVVNKAALGHVFPSASVSLPSIPPTAPHSSSGAGTVGQ
jgi:hypothetical protein